ncbi:3-deoxy-D-manno-octulosonic acid kinase [Thaumasiovibrio sp. DFM-14]|uniref:3-deoxy-D-manno-octulosonic acid kinase n=1 Tax=Thaumasiovibrio sp. DFM-14 TaxID=3384792 RepID=UPI0039A19A3F
MQPNSILTKTVQRDNITICFNSSLLTEPPEKVFDIQYWQQQDKVLGSAQGRGITWFVQGKQSDFALRHYYRGGLFGKLVHDSYLMPKDINQTRAFKEFSLLVHLHANQVPVPQPAAARVIRLGAIYTADILTEKIPNSRDLVAVLQETSLPQAIWKTIGHVIRRLHDAQVNHTDLNAHNILLDDHQQIWLIDFDKCNIMQGNHWKKTNLDRLARSFYKEKDKSQIAFSRKDWQILLQSYNSNTK